MIQTSSSRQLLRARPLRPRTGRAEIVATFSRDDFVVGHHPKILVLKIVAVKQIATGVAGEARRNENLPSGRGDERVFPTMHRWVLRHTVDFQNLELDQMNVNRMRMV